MPTVIMSKTVVWLAAAFLIATAISVFVETALLFAGIHREPPYYVVALFAAGAFLSEIDVRKG